MAVLKLTKTELRGQQIKLLQLQKYLPTLQLKKLMLQLEINQTNIYLEQLLIQFHGLEEKIVSFAPLLSDKKVPELYSSIKIQEIKKREENIAGVDIPIFEDVVFEPSEYSLFDTPIWLDSSVRSLKDFIVVREKIKVLERKKELLQKELREVSIRVNLFEKIMIPRTLENIKKIKIFLGDQQLAAVSQAKVSKRKILMRKGL